MKRLLSAVNGGSTSRKLSTNQRCLAQIQSPGRKVARVVDVNVLYHSRLETATERGLLENGDFSLMGFLRTAFSRINHPSQPLPEHRGQLPPRWNEKAGAAIRADGVVPCSNPRFELIELAV
jgi:hypothetical protein